MNSNVLFINSKLIVKALVLSLSAIAVVARSLPLQRSEINARAGGGHGLSNPTKHDGADVKGHLEANPTLSKGDTQVHDNRNALCKVFCPPADQPKRNPEDCKAVYQHLFTFNNTITVHPGNFAPFKHGDCAVFLTNCTPKITLIYDSQHLAEWVQYLNSDDVCGTPIRGCIFDDTSTIVLNRSSVPLNVSHASIELV